MVKAAEGVGRPVGRPRDPAKVDAVLTASWRLFLARGVEAVTVDDIAVAAGVSRGTVYARFPDKRALFQEGVRREMAKIEAAQAQALGVDAEASLREVLVAFGVGIMTFLGGESAVDFYNLLAGELRRDPELARLFYDAGPGRTHANLAAILSGPLAADLKIVDPAQAAEMLFGMWQGLSNYRQSLGVEAPDRPADVAQRVRGAVDVFIRAHAAAPRTEPVD